MVMKAPLYLIPPISALNQEKKSREDSFDLFKQRVSWDEALYLGLNGASAPLLAYELSKNAPDQSWICLELVHIHATRDHLVLLPTDTLNILEEEEITLRKSINDLLIEIAPEALSINQRHWLFPTDLFDSLVTHSPTLACGNNIDVWMPKDSSTPGLARKWRQLQNEIQMIWHDHPVNQERQNQNQPTINSVWLHGIGNLQQITPHPLFTKIKRIASNKPFLKPFATWQHKIHSDLQMLSAEFFQEYSLIDARDETNPVIWEEIWQKAIDRLHKKQINELILIEEVNGQPMECHLTNEDFKPSLAERIFKRHTLEEITNPTWHAFQTKSLKWNIMNT